MNWVGGIRKRMKLHSEKKIQTEYFEKKKFASRCSFPSSPKKRAGVSQDLLVLHTVNRTHSFFDWKSEQPGRNRARTDLNKAKSVWRNIEEIKLPSSPLTTPSNLLLKENSTSENEKLDLYGCFRVKSNGIWLNGTRNIGHCGDFLETKSVNVDNEQAKSTSKDIPQLKETNAANSPHEQKFLLGEHLQSLSNVFLCGNKHVAMTTQTDPQAMTTVPPVKVDKATQWEQEYCQRSLSNDTDPKSWFV